MQDKFETIKKKVKKHDVTIIKQYGIIALIEVIGVNGKKAISSTDCTEKSIKKCIEMLIKRLEVI